MKVSRQNPPKVGDVIEFVIAPSPAYARYKKFNKGPEARVLLVLEDPNMNLYKSHDWAFCECLDLSNNSVDQWGFNLREEAHTIISRLE